MNAAALRRVRKKHSSWIRYLNTMDGQNYLTYIQARNAASHAIRRARRQFEESLARECKKNNKAVWNYVNSRRKTKAGIGQLQKSDGSFTQSDTEAAEILSEQYYNTFTTEDTSDIPDIPDKPIITEQLHNINISIEEVCKVLKSLKVDKSPGLDEVHPRVLKEAANVLSKPLATIFQESLASGLLPSQWKDALISPIYKKGSRTIPANYRPVSLTSVVCKVLERIIVKHLTAHLKANLLQCEQQHGFTQGKSTVTNLLEAMNIWTEALMHGLPVDIIYLDYSKAFDTVPHERLLRQVSSLGIKGQLLNWIRSFLTGRRQKVKVHDAVSSWRPVESGVPQGSVLGPTLFAMFVCDVPSVVDNMISMFADDTKLYNVITDMDSGTSLSDDLNKLQAWSDKMQMKFHPEKCKVMHLGLRNPCTDYFMRKNDGTVHELQNTTSEKDLGVTVDNQLKFSEHINNIVSKANRVLGCIKHTFKHLNSDTFLLLYKSIVRPHLEYASCVWSPSLKKDKDALERVQRRATKLVPELKDLPYNERLQKLQLPTLFFRRERADMIETYKILHEIDFINQDTHCTQCPTKTMYQKTLSTRTRGHALKLQTQTATGVRSNFLGTRAVQEWNNLSEETVLSPNVNMFKSGLRRDWAQQERLYEYTFSY
jgi:hypothetical protein